jgi:hypothetical protein
MKVTDGGDIGFYNSAGTSQDLYWDASTSRLGLGETNPSHELHIKSATPQIRLEDSDGTNTYGDMQFNGTSLSLITRGGASSHGVMRFQSTDGTDNLTRMEILSSGDIRFNKDDETLGLRWDASETRLGIGTASPLEELHISAAVPTLRLQDSDGTNQYLNIYESGGGANYLARNNTSYGTHNFYGFDGTTSTSFIGITVDAINQNASAAWYIRNRVDGGSLNLGVETSAGSLYYPVVMSGTSDILVFNNAEGEMSRFDTNGNLLVGTTSTSASVAGSRIFSTGRLVTSVDNEGHYFRRNTSDGTIVEFAKDSTTIGSIGTATGDLTIGTGDTGLTFEDAADVIHPINVSTGAARDNAIDLGKSAARFRDLHLSGRSHSVGITNYTSALRLESLDTSVNAEQSIGDIEFAANDSSSGGTGVQAKISAVSDNAFGTAYALTFQTGSQASPSEKVRIDYLGNLLVGTTDTNPTTGTSEGIVLGAGGIMLASNTSDAAIALNRTSTDGDIAIFKKNGTEVGSIGVDSGDNLYIGGSAASHGGLYFGTNTAAPLSAGTLTDDVIDIGTATYRFDDVYATNGTINTSDRNEKQDIEALSDAEQRVAVACKGLLRKFRWKSSVADKGDDARIHFGIIAQDLQDAFTAEGLDAGRYGMFINSTWTDEETGEERSRMGVRYSELLAFIISAI